MEPTQTPAPDGRMRLVQMWLAVFVQSMVFGLVLVVAALSLDVPGYRPEWGPYALGLAVLSILPSIPLWRGYRDMLTSSRVHALSEAERLRLLQKRLMLGLAVADLPALAGFGYYFLTGQLLEMVGFCIVTSVIVYLYRP
ncbi:MAG: hypothetical protein JSW09_04120 [Pseudomonadota bacterium]|nr:MAG: hypothetical protein JSW09_04120 [Pseudomonadota bacterium]